MHGDRIRCYHIFSFIMCVFPFFGRTANFNKPIFQFRFRQYIRNSMRLTNGSEIKTAYRLNDTNIKIPEIQNSTYDSAGKLGDGGRQCKSNLIELRCVIAQTKNWPNTVNYSNLLWLRVRASVCLGSFFIFTSCKWLFGEAAIAIEYKSRLGGGKMNGKCWLKCEKSTQKPV